MQPIRVNRLFNKISNLLTKAVGAASARINNFPGAAVADVRSGEAESSAKESLAEAYDILHEEIDDSLADLDDQLEQAQESIDDIDFDTEPLAEWAQDANADYPEFAGRFDADPNCPGQSHDSNLIFGDIADAIEWARPIGSFWVINSPDDGRTFNVTVCNDS